MSAELRRKLSELIDLQDTITDRGWKLCNLPLEDCNGPELRAEMERAQFQRGRVIEEIVATVEEIAAQRALDESANASDRARHFLAQFWKMKSERDGLRCALSAARGERDYWRKLLRQAEAGRDEALATCTELAESWDDVSWDLAEAMRQYDEQQKRACQAENDRDLHHHRAEWWADRTREKERERDDVREKLADALEQRDTAEALHGQAVWISNDWSDRALRAEAERDAANRAQAREARGHQEMIGAYEKSQENLAEALEQRDSYAGELDEVTAERDRLREALSAIEATARMIVETQHTMSEPHRGLVQLLVDRCHAELRGRSLSPEEMEAEERQALRFDFYP